MGLRRSCAHFTQLEVEACSSNLQSELRFPAALAHEGCVYKLVGSAPITLNSAASQLRLDASLLGVSSEGHADIVQDLLVRGARPNALRFKYDGAEFATWHLPAILGHIEVVRRLIKGGAFVPPYLQKGVLCEALDSGRIDVVRSLTADAIWAIRHGILASSSVTSLSSADLTKLEARGFRRTSVYDVGELPVKSPIKGSQKSLPTSQTYDDEFP